MPGANGARKQSGQRILVVGAGIGGLSAGLALINRGFAVDIFEQARELKDVGAGIQISPNGTRTLRALGVLDDLMPLACAPAGKEVRLWNTGQTWKLFDLGTIAIERYGAPYVTVYRPDLLSVLAAGVRRANPDAIHLNTRCVAAKQNGSAVKVELDDGREIHGDVLVGADGVHSTIRQMLFGEDKPKFTGIMAWRTVVPMERLPAHMRRMVGTNWVGPGKHVVNYPVRCGTLMNFVGAVDRDDWQVESWTVQGSPEECTRDFTGWHADIHHAIRNAPALNKWALLARDPMDRWSAGHVTLLGDACHAMLPFLAQGAVMAIEDGYVLARCLEKYRDDIPTALTRYEDARRERTRRAIVGSAQNATRFHNPKLADAAGAQEYVDREWTEERIRERYEWQFTYDVTTVAICDFARRRAKATADDFSSNRQWP